MNSRYNIGEVGLYYTCRVLFHFSPHLFLILQIIQRHQLGSVGFVIPTAKWLIWNLGRLSVWVITSKAPLLQCQQAFPPSACSHYTVNLLSESVQHFLEIARTKERKGCFYSASFSCSGEQCCPCVTGWWVVTRWDVQSPIPGDTLSQALPQQERWISKCCLFFWLGSPPPTAASVVMQPGWSLDRWLDQLPEPRLAKSPSTSLCREGICVYSHGQVEGRGRCSGSQLGRPCWMWWDWSQEPASPAKGSQKAPMDLGRLGRSWEVQLFSALSSCLQIPSLISSALTVFLLNQFNLALKCSWY